MSENYKVASYCRVSTTRQIDNGSIQEQEARARALCHERGYELVEVYRDEGISGSLFTERGDLQRLIADARAGRFQFVLIAAVDRLARTEVVFAQIVDALEMSLHIQVVDTLTPEFLDPARFNPKERGRRFLQGIKALIAQDQYLGIIENLNAGKRRAVERGEYIYSHPPFGYAFAYDNAAKRSLIPDPLRYPALDTIKRLAFEGVGAEQIAKRLDAMGVPTTRGGRWNSATVLCILRNPFYAGKIGHGKKVRENGKERSATRAEMRYSEHAYPHPWEWEEWQALQDALRDRHRGRGAVVPSKNVFSPVLRCGYCGGSMLFFRQTKRGLNFDYYLCRRWRSNTSACRPNQIPVKRLMSRIEQEIEANLETLETAISNPDRIPSYGVAGLLAQQARNKKQYDALLRRAEEIKERYVTGEISKREYDELRAASLAARTRLEAEGARLAGELAAEQARVVDSRKVRGMRDKWEGMREWLYAPVPDWTEEQGRMFKKLVSDTFLKITATNRGKGAIELEIELKRYVTSSE